MKTTKNLNIYKHYKTDNIEILSLYSLHLQLYLSCILQNKQHSCVPVTLVSEKYQPLYRDMVELLTVFVMYNLEIFDGGLCDSAVEV